MGLLFKDDMLDEFGSMPLGFAPYGGADFGEVRAVAQAVGDGDVAAFVAAWTGAGERLAGEAEAALAAGHPGSARELFLRASVHYGAALRPIFGAPADPRLVAAYGSQMALFDRAMALGTPPAAPFDIPFDGARMRAYLFPADGAAEARRPLLILTNGYDGTLPEMYFSSAVAAVRRGYHVLAFDGPGQGGMLFEQGVAMRPDWETVVAAVVDHALTLPVVDPARIALSGWSLGGHLALRAASGEKRLAAVIADPGLWSITGGLADMARKMGASAADAQSAAAGDSAVANRLGEALFAHSPQARWSIRQRGFWVHGVSDFAGYLKAAGAFTLDGRAQDIRCPALLTMAEDDSRAMTAQQVYDALTGPKTLMRFTAAEGAGDHCEMMNRSLLNRRSLDWLDETLGAG